MIAETTDVAVVGGGPAGVAAAITLARSGREVILVDKAQFPRDKCCGDGITTGAVRRYAALGLDPSTVASWQRVDEVILRSPGGRTTAFPLPPVAVARRVDLDAAFLDVALDAGVKVHDGHAVTGGQVTNGTVVLDVDGVGAVAARYAIAADGMWSPLRKLFGEERDAAYLGHWHAFRQYFTNVGDDARRAMWAWFEPDVIPGYVWSFPLADGAANVGFGLVRSGVPTGAMKSMWPELLARPHIAEVLGAGSIVEASHKAWPIPCDRDVDLLAAGGGRVLFVGDAARLADPLTGEGIAQALESGTEAALAILRAGPTDPAGAERRYGAAVGRGLNLDNGLAAALSRVMASRLGAEGALRIAASSAWTSRHFGRWLVEDYPRAVVATPWRWLNLTGDKR